MKNSRAVVNDRQTRLLQLLADGKNHRVEELAQILGFSCITIRRDLQSLEESGAVKRQYGSARLLERTARDAIRLPFDVAHRAIGMAAAAMVQDGDMVFVNSGRITQAFIAALSGKHITVVTNNLQALELTDNDGVTVMLTGGEIDYPALHGELALQSLRMVTAKKCFLDVNGISAAGGMTVSLPWQASINATMLGHCAADKVILAEGDKIGRRLNFRAGELSGITCLITDCTADPQELEKIRKAGVQVVVAGL